MPLQPLTFLRDDLGSLAPLQPPGWPDLLPHFQFYTSSKFCFPIKFMSNEYIIGIGCGIIHSDVAWVAHIIVHPEHRNNGIGKLITQSLVDLVRAKGCKTINLIATDLGAPVYSKLGFTTTTEYLFFKDLNLQTDCPFENIRDYDTSFNAQIAGLDRIASGEKRMTLLEPHLRNGKLFIQKEMVQGYYLPTLGEGLIISSSTEAGTSLMKYHLQKKETIALPTDNKQAIQFLHDHGFKEHRVAKRMQLGHSKAWKPEFMYNRIGGNLG